MSWTWLNFLWRRKKHMHGDIVMYTRQGCHLCEQAWEQLEQARRRHGFALRQVDIDQDAQLVREYGECVPVVVVNGRVRFRGAVNGVLLRRLLETEANETRRHKGP
jgi:glutaredoxin